MEEVIISTELMSEVIGEKVHRCGFTDEFLPNDLHYVSANPVVCGVINRYEFMHKCKEYCTRHRYSLLSGNPFIDTWQCEIIKNGIEDRLFGKTEFEAVIKATQWVIDNKDKQ